MSPHPVIMADMKENWHKLQSVQLVVDWLLVKLFMQDVTDKDMETESSNLKNTFWDEFHNFQQKKAVYLHFEHVWKSEDIDNHKSWK